MVQKAGEINLFFTTFVNKTTMDSFGLFHQLFEPSNSNQCKSIIFYGNPCFFSLFKQWSAGRGHLGHMHDTHKMTERRSIESLNFIGH